MVFSASGVAEKNAVFRTDFPAQGGPETWIVCRYEQNSAIEFIRVVPEHKVNRLDVALTAARDASSIVSWTNTYTGLSEAGNQWIRCLTDDAFRAEKEILEKLLNHYLKTGTMLKWADLGLEADPYGQPGSH
jgi:hypothetical protein